MAGSQKQVMDIKVAKGFSQAQSDEHKRNWDDDKWQKVVEYGNYDRTRQHLNFEIVDGRIMPLDPSVSIKDRISKSLEDRGIKDPNEGLSAPKFRTVVNIIFGGSRDQMRKLAFGDQEVDFDKKKDNSHIVRKKEIENWALDVYRFVAEKYGEENIAGFTVHLDEINPHVHCTLLPILENKFAYKKIFAGKDINEYKARMKQLHDELAKVNAKYGLVRGEPVGVTQSFHKTTREYRYELSRECVTLEEQIENNKMLLNQLRLEVAHAQKRVKGLTTMINNLERKKSDLEGEMSRISDDIASGRGDEAELKASIKRLEKEYEKVQASLADKRQKLNEANRTLAEFKDLENESRERAATYREQAQEYRQNVSEAAQDLTRQIQFRISDAAVYDIIRQLQTVLPQLGDVKVVMDSSILSDFAERGESILKCAGMLFAGYIDGAIQFAETHGGGGSDTGGWGRKDDEDDLMFSRRCIFQAARMMRPSSGKSVKRK